MGCWNSTCILSNLSISYGQCVVLFPLWEGHLVLFPMRGTYNDYGSIEKVDAHPLQEESYGIFSKCAEINEED